MISAGMAEKDEENGSSKRNNIPGSHRAQRVPQPLTRVVRGDGFFVVTGPGE